MAGTLQQFFGFEYPSQLFTISTFLSRENTVIDPLAGAQSIRSPETGTNRDYRIGLLSSIGPGGAAPRGGMGYWYHVAAAPTAAISMACFNFTAGGGTVQNFNLCVRTDLKLEMYSAGTSDAAQGTATGTVSATALTAATGYWIWIDVDYPSATGTVTINVYVDYALFYTYTFTATGGATSTVACNLFGISGATAGSVNHYVDNAISVTGVFIPSDTFYSIDGSEGGGHQWRAAVKLSTVTADGTDNDFTASAGDRYTTVDEATPNADTDYVSIDSTSAQEQTFQMSDPGAPESPGKYRPVAIEHRISHRNADAGKWAATHGGRSYFQNTLSGAGTTAPDPGGSYGAQVMSPSGYWRVGAAGGRLSYADIADMEMGVFMTADANEAAQWRITAVQAEVLYLPPLVLYRERVRMRGVARGVMRGAR